MRSKALFVLAAAALVPACSSAVPGEAQVQDSIDSYIRTLPYLPVEPATVATGSASPAQFSGDYSCTTTNMQETRQYDSIVAYAANSDSLWPGALVSADSVLTGLFTQVVMPRAPATISVSMENLAGSKQATIANPSLAAYRDALSSIISSDVTGSTAANLYSEIEQVHSEEQLNMALGVQASWGLGIASLKSSFNFSNDQVMSRYIVKYTQQYYTVDLDAPADPSAVLDPTVPLTDVQTHMNAQHPPAYVSSVTYGRLVIFTFESTYSAEEMGAALDFAYSGGVDVSGNVSVSYKDIISNSKITAFILGGDAGTAAQSIDSYDSLMAFIKAGGNYSKESPGAPIAYKLNYLADNTPARMSETTDYDVKECTRVTQQVQVTLSAITVDDAGGDSGDDLELYGDITAQGNGDATNMFHKDTNNYVQIHQGATFGNPIGTAIINVNPAAGQTITLTAHLHDYDTFSGNDDLGTEISINPFEAGWRKDVTVTLTGDSTRVRVTFSLAPI